MSSSATEGQPDFLARNADEDTTGHLRAFSGPKADDDRVAEDLAAREKEQGDDTEGHAFRAV